MITKINNADDALLAFNENFEGLLTLKRKIPFGKEINNTLGKMCNVVKMQLMHKALTGDKTPLAWFNERKEIKIIATSASTPMPFNEKRTQLGYNKGKKGKKVA